MALFQLGLSQGRGSFFGDELIGRRQRKRPRRIVATVRVGHDVPVELAKYANELGWTNDAAVKSTRV